MTTNPVTETDVIKPRITLKIILISLGVVLICTSPFWAEPFRYQKEELGSLRKEQRQIPKDFENSITNLRVDFESGKLSNQEYIASFHKEFDNLKDLRAANSEKIDNYIDENGVFDWANSYVFFVAFGTRIPSLLFGVLLLLFYKIDIIKIDSKKLRLSFFCLTSGSLANGIFWQTWVFWPFNDLSFNSYLITSISLRLLIGTAITQFMLWRKIKIEKLKGIIRHLNSVLITIIPGRIKNIPVEEYEEIVWESLEYQADEG